MSSELTPIFVTGVPRSGTTWVQRILATHPEAFPLVEPYMFSSMVGLGALFGSLGAAHGEETTLSKPGMGRLFQRPELVVEVRAVANRWLRAGIGQGPRFAIEKSPWHLHEITLIAEVLPEARFVNVLRDGRDVAVSLLEARRTWSDAGPAEPRAVVREAARVWRDGVALADRAQSAVRERLLEVRFEQLRREPRDGHRRLFEHCGMPFDDALLDRSIERTEFERATEPRGEGQALRSGRIGEWRERFGIRDAWSFNRIAGPALRETDYEDDPDWWRRRPLRSRL